MEWLDKLTQHTLFPGQYIYKVEPIFEECDIHKVRVLDITFDVNGLKCFYYQSINRNGLYHWVRGDRSTEDRAFFHSVQDAITWCQKQGKKFTIYDPIIRYI